MSCLDKLRQVGSIEPQPSDQERIVSQPTPKPVRPDWLAAWRELATITDGITKDDPRFQPIMDTLDACDRLFLANDWAGFLRASEAVRRAATAKMDGLGT